MSRNVRRFVVGALYGFLGVVAVALAFRLSPQVSESATYWLVFGAFAAVVVVFSVASAEVDERLLVSSIPMVLMTAAGFLSSPAIDPSVVPSATLPVTLLAVFGFYTRGDLKDRQYFRAIANFGQLTVVAFAAGTIFDWLLPLISEALSDGTIGDAVAFQSNSRWVLAGAVTGMAASAVFAVVNYALVRFGVRVLYGTSAHVPWSSASAIIGSVTIQGFLGSLLGVLLALRPSIALVILTLTVFAIGHLVFVSQATLRATHENFLRGFVKILETRDLYTRGHTERVVEFSLAIGYELRLSARQLSRLRLAALIHDVGKLAVPTEIMRKQGALTDAEFHQLRVATHRVDDLLSEVGFLDPLVTIYSGCHPKWDGEDFGQTRHVHTRVPTVEQSVLAVADAFDAMTSTRSYRMAMPQTDALRRLAESDDPLFDPDVVSALERALCQRGGSYGPPEMTPAVIAGEGGVRDA